MYAHCTHSTSQPNKVYYSREYGTIVLSAPDDRTSPSIRAVNITAQKEYADVEPRDVCER